MKQKKGTKKSIGQIIILGMICMSVLCSTWVKASIVDASETNFSIPDLLQQNQEKEIEKTSVSIKINQANISTLQRNENVQMIVKLLNNKNQLYKNPVIEVILPRELEIDVKNVVQLNYEDEVKIKEITKGESKDNEEAKILKIALEGEQKTFAKNTEQALQIAIMGDIQADNKTPSKDSQIKVSCTNENNMDEIEMSECPIKIVSKYGVLMLNKIENYNQQAQVTQIKDNEMNEVQLDILSEEKQAKQTIQVINNYENAISQISILGKVAENQTIDVNFQDVKILQEKNAKIYYSEKAQEDSGSIEWKEHIEEVEKIRAYKIVLEDEIQSGESLDIDYNVYIPENIKVGENSDIKTTLEYEYLGNKEITESNIKLGTGNQQEETFTVAKAIEETNGINVEIAAVSGGQYLKEGDTVKEGQGIKYVVSLTNVSDADMNNVVIEATNTNAMYYNMIAYEEEVNGILLTKYKIDEDDSLTSKRLEVGELKQGETKEVSYQVAVRKVDNEEQSITGQIKITADDYKEQIIQSMANKIATGHIKAKLRFTFSEDVVTGECSGIPLELNVENISENVLNDVIVELPLARNLEFTEDEVAPSEQYEYLEFTNQVAKFKIPQINAGETVSIYTQLTVGEIEATKQQEVISQYFRVIDNNATYVSNSIERTVEKRKVEIVVNQTTNITKDVIDDGENVKFFITIQNKGAIEKEISIEDEIPDGLEINYIKFKTSEEEKELDIPSKNWLVHNVTIKPNETIEMEIDTTLVTDNAFEAKISNHVTVDGAYVDAQSNVIEFKINGIEDDNEDDYEDNDEIDDNTEEDYENNDDDDDVHDHSYSIAGTAWVDENQDGEKQSSETNISNIPVFLINNETGVVEKETKTGQEGIYSFNGLTQGKYIVVFQYDNSKYTITTYQKSGVSEALNSDVIYSVMNIQNREMAIAKTKTLEMTNKNLENIDAGFVEAKTFDLKIDKTISKVSVQNRAGTKVNSYNNQKLAKLEIDAKYLANSNVIIQYNIAVTNQGELAGYANEIVDYLPKDLQFKSEMNKSWYQNTDGSIATKELSNQIINPGETKNLTLTVVKTMTQNNTGTTTNKASISKSSNDYDVADKNNSDNESQAEVIISVRTGAIIMYVSLIVSMIALVVVGVYFIKTKVLVERR